MVEGMSGVQMGPGATALTRIPLSDPDVQAILKEIAEDCWARAEKAEAPRSARDQDDD
jgi:hypothetical protein